MINLPVLVLNLEVVQPRVLQIGGENDGFVPRLAWQLNSQIPIVERNEDKVGVL